MRDGVEREGGDVDIATGLIHLSRLVQSIQARVADRHGLTPVQGKLLCVLAESPRRMGELAQGFGVEKAALTGLIDRVEGRGLAERVAVPGDRRSFEVALTEAGRRSAAAFHAEATAELEALVSVVSPAERERLRRAVARVIDASATSLATPKAS